MLHMRQVRQKLALVSDSPSRVAYAAGSFGCNSGCRVTKSESHSSFARFTLRRKRGNIVFILDYFHSHSVFQRTMSYYERYCGSLIFVYFNLLLNDHIETVKQGKTINASILQLTRMQQDARSER